MLRNLDLPQLFNIWSLDVDRGILHWRCLTYSVNFSVQILLRWFVVCVWFGVKSDFRPDTVEHHQITPHFEQSFLFVSFEFEQEIRIHHLQIFDISYLCVVVLKFVIFVFLDETPDFLQHLVLLSFENSSLLLLCSMLQLYLLVQIGSLGFSFKNHVHWVELTYDFLKFWRVFRHLFLASSRDWLTLRLVINWIVYTRCWPRICIILHSSNIVTKYLLVSLLFICDWSFHDETLSEA